MMFKIRLARAVEYARTPGNGEERHRERRVQRERTECRVKFAARLRRGERGSFRAADGGVGGLRARRDTACRRHRRRRQKTVFK